MACNFGKVAVIHKKFALHPKRRAGTRPKIPEWPSASCFGPSGHYLETGCCCKFGRPPGGSWDLASDWKNVDTGDWKSCRRLNFSRTGCVEICLWNLSKLEVSGCIVIIWKFYVNADVNKFKIDIFGALLTSKRSIIIHLQKHPHCTYFNLLVFNTFQLNKTKLTKFYYSIFNTHKSRKLTGANPAHCNKPQST
jgi:hypothetical protein